MNGNNLIVFIIAAVTIIIVVGLWQGLSATKTETNQEQVAKYEKIAEATVEFNQKSAVTQEKTMEVLKDIQTRLASIEKILREVQ
ncbi:MAG: hypothetical protein IT311_02585 [Anaerolineales bacterium]|nr:hypothetical protein [Anaerolineales bacterium]